MSRVTPCNRRDVIIGAGGLLLTGASGATLAPKVAGAIGIDSTTSYYFERSFQSSKTYADPFNEVEVDVIFTLGRQSWRVPTFWRGGSTWTVRFAPPVSGEYALRLQCNDRTNVDLNGPEQRIRLRRYAGSNELVRHGMLRVSSNRRYFEHQDGTPFFWLSALGQQDDVLARASRAMGFTIATLQAGLAPWRAEVLRHPDFSNAGGFVWEQGFARIHPGFFDEMDRVVERHIDAGIVPQIIGGGWWWIIDNMGIAKMKQQWRNVIARYGAQPVVWMLCFELPNAQNLAGRADIHEGRIEAFEKFGREWGEVAKYVRAVDPYHHPLSAVELPAPFHGGFRDTALTDFDLPLPAFFGWPGVAAAVAQISALYGRKHVTKPVVQGDITPEDFAGEALEDYHRIGFWLAVLNGAAGHIYYHAGEGEQRRMLDAPGARQVALGARLLQKYPWHRFVPHPEWVTPRGTTLFDVNTAQRPVDLDIRNAYLAALRDTGHPLENEVPAGEWRRRKGTFRRPYAAGIAGVVRIIYVPYTGYVIPDPPTILLLEENVKYRAYFWNPETGAEVELGAIEHASPTPIVCGDPQAQRSELRWIQHSDGDASNGRPRGTLSLLRDFQAQNVVASVDFRADEDIALILRYRDPDNYVAVHFVTAERRLFIRIRANGKDREPASRTDAGDISLHPRLIAEVRDGYAIASIRSQGRRVTTEIVSLGLPLGSWPQEDGTQLPGAAGVLHRGSIEAFGDFELRQGQPSFPAATGRGHRGSEPLSEVMVGRNLLLLDAYRPEWFPTNRDWVLVLESPNALDASA